MRRPFAALPCRTVAFFEPQDLMPVVLPDRKGGGLATAPEKVEETYASAVSAVIT
jgi:hypothetical protein